MLNSASKTCGRVVLLTLLLAVSSATALAEPGEVDLSIGSRDYVDIKAFNDLVVILQAGGLPDGTLNVVNVHYSAPTGGYAADTVFVSITCYDPHVRGVPSTEGRVFPEHAIPAGESDEAGLFCPPGMTLVDAEASVWLTSP